MFLGHLYTRMWDLILEIKGQISDLVEEEDEGRTGEEGVVEDGLEELQALLHPVGAVVLEKNLRKAQIFYNNKRKTYLFQTSLPGCTLTKPPRTRWRQHSRNSGSISAARTFSGLQIHKHFSSQKKAFFVPLATDVNEPEVQGQTLPLELEVGLDHARGGNPDLKDVLLGGAVGGVEDAVEGVEEEGRRLLDLALLVRLLADLALEEFLDSRVGPYGFDCHGLIGTGSERYAFPTV